MKEECMNLRVMWKETDIQYLLGFLSADSMNSMTTQKNQSHIQDLSCLGTEWSSVTIL